MLQGGFTEVLSSRNRDEFRGEIVSFANRLGFDKVAATVVIDHLLAEPEFIIVDNTPSEYREQFASFSNGRRDPVMQHCKRQRDAVAIAESRLLLPFVALPVRYVGVLAPDDRHALALAMLNNWITPPALRILE